VPSSQEQHGLDKALKEMLANMIQQQPKDPVQFMIDSIQFNAEYAAQVGGCSARGRCTASFYLYMRIGVDGQQLTDTRTAQDPKTGLPQHRRDKLLDVFHVMGNVSCAVVRVSCGWFGLYGQRAC
jgi:hypothetical protein